MLFNHLKNGEINHEEEKVKVESELAKRNVELEALPPIINDLHQYALAFANSPHFLSSISTFPRLTLLRLLPIFLQF